ncbi:rhodanese-like domain-containing protein [Elstera cyanobacteriorum]|uniref:Sulfurtransferase n=1 Tax=Elstera cyanobacteriorum TaxID=2022747 RepID=A0A255XIL2_9PROT|nr:rhodanese-like domain-containing protein [Elstera cyanobacteriorum]MCK6442857.1 rhodanese-like domain-containing protein [Elstera cyanobacteriorum]OYQ16731.1 sulfurtransferase [Elstera cyanobacteriorum]GFZ88155.1 sulfurtransferase [Elstera cyanobacteriorum]
MSDYAGDVSPQETWAALKGDPAAILIDVRTPAEWAYVGLPDVAPLGKLVLTVAWQTWPDGSQNPAFIAEAEAQGLKPGQSVYLLCRSGVRSLAAAKALTAAGFGPCYNIAGGFEGPLDPERHRGSLAGWKAEGLPWRQS